MIREEFCAPDKCVDLSVLKNEVSRLLNEQKRLANAIATLNDRVSGVLRDVDKNSTAIDQIKPILHEVEELQKIVFENGVTLKVLVKTIEIIKINTSKQRANATTLLVAAVTSIVGPVIVLLLQFLIAKP